MDPFFLADGSGGQRLCLYHRPPSGAASGIVVYVHPFAEEMNKSRHMAAQQARALAAAGHAVLQVDLLGCGDSSGDFGDASWAAWVADVVRVAAWLRERHADAPLWLWGLRAGCLIAAEAARQIDAPCHFLFWQPLNSGKAGLQQFLRLKAAADLLDAGAKGVVAGLRAQLAEGRPVDVAGYALAPDLASGFERAVLQPPKPGPGRVEWFELGAAAQPELSPAAALGAAAWRKAGYDVRQAALQGPAFWQTQEIEQAPALIAATSAALPEAVAA
ncbi:MAG: hydrolase 2, exosortase A system-associated [Burkholderiales bacterium]|nr:hydrolase 2, exosortase A system-associated [Burkholderiales bacterium]